MSGTTDLKRLPQKPIALVVALKDEERAVLAAFGHRGWYRAGPYPYRRGKIAGEDVLLVRTGIGTARVEERLSRLLEVEDPSLVVMIGFGGGLRGHLRVGDVVVASEVLELPKGLPPEGGAERVSGRTPETAPLWTSRSDLVALAVRVEPPPLKTWTFQSCSGRVVTSDLPVTTAAAKRAMGESLDALAVDMESSAAFRLAASAGIPALCVRAILDEASREIPLDLERLLTPEGRPRPLRLLEAIAWEPERIRDLASLRSCAKTAARSLAAYVPRLVEAIGEGVGRGDRG